MRDDEMGKVQFMIDNTYQNFMQKVSDARGMSVEQVDEIAQGRVWTGIDAKEIGLVDEIGGLKESIYAAAELAGLGEDFSTINYPIIKSDPFQEIMSEMVGSAKMDVMESELENAPELLHTYRLMKRINEMKGIQMRMAYDIIIQ